MSHLVDILERMVRSTNGDITVREGERETTVRRL